MSAPSPTPSNMPPPNSKRPRPSAASASTTVGGTTTSGPRTKRRKPEESVGPESTRGGGAMNFGVGMVKGREEEWGEPGEVKTKVDFNELPVETLYKYLEYHDLLPRWDVSPWSEDPCTPPNQLYTLPPPAPIVPIASQPGQPPAPDSPRQRTASPVPAPAPATIPAAASEPPVVEQASETNGATVEQTTYSGDVVMGGEGGESLAPKKESDIIPVPSGLPAQTEGANGIENRVTADIPTTTTDGVTIEQPSTELPSGESNTVASSDPQAGPQPPITEGEGELPAVAGEDGQAAKPETGAGPEGEADVEGGQPTSPSPPYIEPPTTRSKTAPTRRPPTPTPPPPPPAIKRGVITLSDVYAAREVLAEKANAHWMKGLGGGQNKEGETIVNFLYKMKVGQGRLLRVYNPSPATYPGW
ncbi:hypothetical protein CI109_103492 [Kwoniella shandongensis]|uniref:Uncharacterized protein n=1 Tax=Kwoniella shandongensis TaxID=1734106 RepID=A0A5M6BXZ9_9TREE|nr:uncharacterized protein CI109_004605 [Kwoniella shandongensis]KAA5527070.1 hypothetical protein CI109_004605 [Kwoniella shandongensis]